MRSIGLGSLRWLIGALFLLPLFWVLVAAFYPPSAPLPTGLALFPHGISAENFTDLFRTAPFGRYTLNSLRVVALAVPITLVTASWAGYAIAQLPATQQRRLILFSFAVLMVPSMALWLPRFILYRWLGWQDSVWALIAPAWMGSSPFFVLMFYRAFRRLPPALSDAARLEGAGPLTVWWRIALPLVRPTTLAVAFLTFVLYWGDFVSPLLYISAETKQTLPVGLQLLQQLPRADWSLLMAGTLYTLCIPVGLLLIIQFWFGRTREL